MSVYIDQWRAVIGMFYANLSCIPIKRCRCMVIGQNSKIILFFFCSFFVLILLLKHGDIEINPGPKKKLAKCFSCCHWNVNSILAHNKLSLLTAYNSALNYDLICLTETYLDSTVDPNNLLINGYNLLRADHPDNVKRGGVCLYYRENLTLRLVDTTYIEQCILCEINIQNTTGYVAVIYRSPSQSSNEFEEFLASLGKLMNQVNMLKSCFTVILGDFNARSQSWWSDDITSYEGSHIDSLTTTYGFHQLISDPTHLLPNSSSYIDHQQVKILNNTLMNVFSNFIPNKLVTFNDKDPPWMSEYLKNKIKWRNKIYAEHLNENNGSIDYTTLQNVIVEVSELVCKSKDDYHKQLARKLTNPKTSSKTYWSILKTFYNGKKVPLIPPLVINNKLEPDFKRKADHFNKFFASRCTPLKNDSVLPTLLEHESEARFSKITFTDDQILKILRALDINKAHGHDEISIRMLKLCDKSIITPLSILFQNCIDTRTFPDTWKKSNIVPVHKKGDKQIVDNYRPVSLLPILGKIFERVIFNSIFEYLEENNLLCPNQSGFRPSDSCEYQLLSILHEIYKSFDCNPPKDVRGIFLDLSKAFDRVWHDGLIYKIKRIGIAGNSLKLIESFLSNRFQRVVLNGQSSSWAPV